MTIPPNDSNGSDCTARSDADYRAQVRAMLSASPSSAGLPPPFFGYNMVGLQQEFSREPYDPVDGPVHRELTFFSSSKRVYFGWVRPLSPGQARVVKMIDATGQETAVDKDIMGIMGFFDFGCPTQDAPAKIVVEFSEPHASISIVIWGLSVSVLDGLLHEGG